MVKKRDGPAPFSATPGPKQKDDVSPRLLPPQEIPRKGHTSPSSHPRSRRRQPTGWREFRVRLVTKPSADGAAALYAYLRAAAKRFGLEVANVDEVHNRGEEP